MTVEDLWQEHSAKLTSYVHKRVGDFHTAEDIVQEVAVRLNKSAGRLEELTDPERWLFAVAHNLIVDHYRRVGDNKLMQIPHELHEEIEAEDGSQNREAAECLLRLSESLPQEYRQALLSADYLGLPQKQTSEQLGISYSGYKSRVQRARRRLKSAMLSCCRVSSDPYGNIVAMERRERTSTKKPCPKC